MTKMTSQITSLTVVYSTVYSDADQIKHQSSASLAFVWGIHRDRWIPRTKGQLRGKCFHLMTSSCNGQGPVSLRFFHHNSNSMEISFHFHLDSNTVIATKLCTWHDSCAVVACAKICCDLMASSRVMARRCFHRIWFAGKKPLVKRDPGPDGIAAKWNLPRIWIVMEKHQWNKPQIILWYFNCQITQAVIIGLIFQVNPTFYSQYHVKIGNARSQNISRLYWPNSPEAPFTNMV